jgi:hypothetical protein
MHDYELSIQVDNMAWFENKKKHLNLKFKPTNLYFIQALEIT